MATNIATLQTIWDCRWSQLGRQPYGAAAHRRPEPVFVCVRHPGKRRGVTEQECEECGFWEKEEPDVAGSTDA